MRKLLAAIKNLDNAQEGSLCRFADPCRGCGRKVTCGHAKGRGQPRSRRNCTTDRFCKFYQARQAPKPVAVRPHVTARGFGVLWGHAANPATKGVVHIGKSLPPALEAVNERRPVQLLDWNSDERRLPYEKEALSLLSASEFLKSLNDMEARNFLQEAHRVARNVYLQDDGGHTGTWWRRIINLAEWDTVEAYGVSGPCRIWLRPRRGVRQRAKPRVREMLFLTRSNSRVRGTKEMVQQARAAGWRVTEHVATENIEECVKHMQHPPVCVIRWEEGGQLFVNDKWRAACEWCHENSIKPIQVDFGYFDHYRTRLMDVYNRSAETTIRREWPELPERVQWEDADKGLLAYRQKMRADWEAAEKLGPVPGTEPGYVLLYLQGGSGPTLSRLPAKTYPEWIQKSNAAVRAAGLVPVWKTSPITRKPMPEGTISFGNPDKIPQLNARLLRFARHSVIISSTVSNEAVLRGLPVVGAGKSWYSGLEVFAEATNWADLAVTPVVNHKARAKWMNFWIRRQFPAKQFADALEELLRQEPGKAAFYTSGGLGNLMMNVPALKGVSIALGRKIDVGHHRYMPQGYADLIGAQTWIEVAHARAPDTENYDVVTSGATPWSHKVLAGTPGSTQVIPAGRHARYPHEVHRHGKAARNAGFKGILPSARIRVPVPDDRFKLPTSYVTVGMDCTDGKAWSNRRWPHWGEFAKLWQKHRVPLVFLGVKKQDWAKTYGLDLVGQTTPTDVAAIISEADAHVGIDCGVSHIAGAVRTPSVVVYGPTSSLQYGPWQPSLTAIAADIPCRPCIVRNEWYTCRQGRSSCPCMESVRAQQVVDALANVLERHGQPDRTETRLEQVRARMNEARILGAPAAQASIELASTWEHIEELRPAVVLEIGVKLGGWLFSVAPACTELNSLLIGVDAKATKPRETIKKRLEEEGHRVVWVNGNSRAPETLQGVKAALDGRRVCLLHIDGGHTTELFLHDWETFMPLVRDGGLVVIHDAHSAGGGVEEGLKQLRESYPERVISWHTAMAAQRTPILGVTVARIGKVVRMGLRPE